ncbi:hypothetical protein HZB89_01280 [archaeon]|nr:hypothetical protein [archaeon]
MKPWTGFALNENAFLSIALLFFFVPVLVQLSLMESEAGNAFNKIEPVLLKAEKAGILRKELELNSDWIISQTIAEEVKKGNLVHESVKEKIAANLMIYFNAVEKRNAVNPKISFWIIESDGMNYSGLMNSSKEKASMQAVKENMELWLAGISKGLTHARVSFTGGREKNKAVAGLIEFNEAKEFFLIPVNYSQEFEVIG